MKLCEGLETCDLARFDQLQPGDILFLDCSHRVFMNSDVTVFMIDVLPRLRPGVPVHVHDIVLPWDYPDMFTNWYWSEAYILAAYLIGAREGCGLCSRPPGSAAVRNSMPGSRSRRLI